MHSNLVAMRARKWHISSLLQCVFGECFFCFLDHITEHAVEKTDPLLFPSASVLYLAHFMAKPSRSRETIRVTYPWWCDWADESQLGALLSFCWLWDTNTDVDISESVRAASYSRTIRVGSTRGKEETSWCYGSCAYLRAGRTGRCGDHSVCCFSFLFKSSGLTQGTIAA